MNPEEPPRYQAQPFQPGAPGPVNYGGMNEVQTNYTRVVRPPVVILAAVCWALVALSYPLGRIIVVLASGEQPWWVGNLFVLACTVALFAWPVARFLQGSAQARVWLTVYAVMYAIFAFAFMFTASGPFLVVQVARVALPVLAVVLSFLPQGRWYFAASVQ